MKMKKLISVGFAVILACLALSVTSFAAEAELSNDATLSSLIIAESISASNVPLSPPFTPEQTTYTATVPYETTSITIEATPNDPTASVGGNPGPQPFTVNQLSYDIIVTAENGVATKTYTITVTRAAANKELKLNASGELTYNEIPIPQNTSLDVLGGGSYSYTGGTLTLNGVNFTTSTYNVLDLSAISGVTVNLTGTNLLTSTYDDDSFGASGVYSSVAFTIGGTGSLTATGYPLAENSTYGIYGDMTITGGNITAIGSTSGIYSNDSIIITGGNINASIGGTPKDAVGGSTVYKTTLTGLPANTAVTAFSKTYGITGVKTDASGDLSFYLPRGTFEEFITLTVGDTVYYGTIPTGNEAKTVTMSSTFNATQHLYLSSSGKLSYAGIEIPQNTASPMLGGGKYSFSGGVFTLDSVNFTTSGSRALSGEVATAYVINLVGDNYFISTYNTPGSESNGLFLMSLGPSETTISGSGSLTATAGTTQNSRGIVGKITISGGNVIVSGLAATNESSGIYSPYYFTISGGNVTATSGAAPQSYGINAYGNLIITGGNINVASFYSAPKDAVGGNDVYKTTFEGFPANTAVTAFSKTYGIKDVRTDAAGKLYFYLPRAAENEAISITLANGKTYSGIIPTGNEAKTVKMTAPTPASEPQPEPEPRYSPSDSSNPPTPNSVPNRKTVGYKINFKTKSGVSASVKLTETGVVVTAGLNKSGSVNSEATVAAVAEAAKIARANGEKEIVIAIPEGATGISKATVQKLVKAANGLKLVLAFTSITDGEEVGSISLPINSKTGQILTGLYFETNRIKSVQNYIAKKWDTDILGSFETAQKGGWGAVATISVNTQKLGFSADDGTKLYAIIYDTKTGKIYQVSAVVIDGNIVIVTKRTGVVTIVTQKVK